MVNKLKNAVLLAGCFLTIATFQSCKDDGGGGDPQPTKSISEFLTSQGGYTEFLGAVETAGLTAKITGSGSVTILAVDDVQLSNDGIDFSSMSVDEVKDFVNYHMLAGKVVPADFTNEGYYSSEASAGPNGEKVSLFTEVDGSSVRFNGATASNNYEATNGMVYEVAGALPLPTLLDHLAINPNLENYSSGVNLEASTKTALQGGPNTVFGINEDALLAFLKTKSIIRISDLAPSERRTIINNTLVYNKALASTSLSGTVSTEGDDISITKSGVDIMLNGSIKVLHKDIIATNGIIHIVDDLVK